MKTRAKLTLPVAMLTGCLLAGCGTNIAVTADSACQSFRPISMSKADTDPTKRQIIGHNKAFDAICTPKGSAPQRVAANG